MLCITHGNLSWIKCTRIIITFFRQLGGGREKDYQWVEINNPFSIQNGNLIVQQNNQSEKNNNVPTKDIFVSSITAITSNIIGKPSSPGVFVITSSSNTITTLPIRSPTMYSVDYYTCYVPSSNSMINRVRINPFENHSIVTPGYYATSFFLVQLYSPKINPATDGSFSSDCDLSVNILAYDAESSAQTTLQVSAISCIRDTMVTTTFIHTVANCVWQQYDFLLVDYNSYKISWPCMASLTVFYNQKV